MSAPPSIRVYTYKDGLLARLAHDLELSLRRFSITREGDQVRGSFWPASLVVEGVIDRRGGLDRRALSDSDRRKIAGNIADDVLQLGRHPEVTFVGKVEGEAAVVGELTMVGRGQPLRIGVQAIEGRLRGEVTLAPSRWGVAPYRALAGAIKLQDRVLVRFDLPAGERWALE